MIIFILFGFISCVDVINLDLPEKDKRLVVEGGITSWDTVYTVKLSKTSKYNFKINSSSEETETGAIVIISDNLGSADTLLEQSDGIYNSKPGNISGEVGRSYKLDIYTKAGKHYTSYAEEMPEVPKIDSIYFERDYQDRKYQNAYRNRIYLDWQDPSGVSNYYLQHITYFWGGVWHKESEWNQLLNDNIFNGEYVRKYQAFSEYDVLGFYIRVTRYSLTKRAFEFWNLLNQQLYPSDESPCAGLLLVRNLFSRCSSRRLILSASSTNFW